MRIAVLFLLVVVPTTTTTTSCRAWREDLAIKSADECIEKKCTDHEVTAMEECRTTCKRRFKK